MRSVGLVDVEAVDDVPEAEDAPRTKHGPHAAQCHHLPEVGKVMQGIAGVHDVGGANPVVIGEEASSGDLDVVDPCFVDLAAEPLEHHG